MTHLGSYIGQWNHFFPLSLVFLSKSPLGWRSKPTEKNTLLRAITQCTSDTVHAGQGAQKTLNRRFAGSCTPKIFQVVQMCVFKCKNLVFSFYNSKYSRARCEEQCLTWGGIVFGIVWELERGSGWLQLLGVWVDLEYPSWRKRRGLLSALTSQTAPGNALHSSSWQ